MKTQFYHDRHDGRTVAVNVDFTANDVLDKLSKEIPPVMNIDVGIAKVHPDDSYCKETGRIVSVEKMELLEFSVGHIDYIGEDVFFNLVHIDSDEKMLTLAFKLKKNKETPFFINAHYNHRNFF